MCPDIFLSFFFISVYTYSCNVCSNHTTRSHSCLYFRCDMPLKTLWTCTILLPEPLSLETYVIGLSGLFSNSHCIQFYAIYPLLQIIFTFRLVLSVETKEYWNLNQIYILHMPSKHWEGPNLEIMCFLDGLLNFYIFLSIFVMLHRLAGRYNNPML